MAGEQHNELQGTTTKGVHYPDHKQLRALVQGLEKQVRASPHIAEAFRRDPRRALSALGLNEDVQRELLIDMKQFAAASDCTWTCLIKTCWCTACCITDVSITSLAPRFADDE
jgi:hypothetical protein